VLLPSCSSRAARIYVVQSSNVCCPCLAAHPRQNRHFSPPEGPVKRDDHNTFTLYHPACLLLACFAPILWTIGSTNESRRFSFETDTGVWKNAVRCLINNISKKQAEENDLRQIVLLKIIVFHLFAFIVILLYFFSTFSGTHVRPCVQVATPLTLLRASVKRRWIDE